MEYLSLSISVVAGFVVMHLLLLHFRITSTKNKLRIFLETLEGQENFLLRQLEVNGLKFWNTEGLTITDRLGIKTEELQALGLRIKTENDCERIMRLIAVQSKFTDTYWSIVEEVSKKRKEQIALLDSNVVQLEGVYKVLEWYSLVTPQEETSFGQEVVDFQKALENNALSPLEVRMLMDRSASIIQSWTDRLMGLEG